MKYITIPLLLCVISLSAQVGGTSTYQFLNAVTSARVAGQGSNAIANPENDLNFALYNPALLTQDMHGQFTTSIVDYVSDVVFGDVAYAHHFDSLKSTFYVQAVFLDYGEFDQTNEVGQKLGTFTASDYSFNVGYGYKLDSNWQFGAKLMTIVSNYAGYNSWGLAGDIGVTYQIPKKRMAVSFLAKNMGFQADPYTDNREPLPFELQLGFSSRFEHLPLRWQLTFEELETFDLRYEDPTAVTVDQFTGEIDDNYPGVVNNILRHMVLGVEFAPSKSFNLQFGYNFRKRQELNLDTRRTSAGFSVGGGLKISKFYVNYSRNMYHIAGSANQITLRTDFQSFGKKKKNDKKA